MGFKDTIKALQDTLKVADPSKLQGINAVYQFDLTGEEGGVAQVKVQDGVAELLEGAPDSPDITITISEADFASLLDGQLNATSAFMAGKLKIKGDMSLALKLQGLLG